MSENKNVVEIHGCIVCANLFNVLVVYAPDGKMLNCTVASPSGHIVPNKGRLLVVCDAHTAEGGEPVYERGLSTNGTETDREQQEDD